MGKRRGDARHQVLSFVESFWAANGYSPSYDEIREGLGLSSRSHAAYHLRVLEREGLIERLPRAPRSLRLVSASAAIRQPRGKDYASREG